MRLTQQGAASRIGAPRGVVPRLNVLDAAQAQWRAARARGCDTPCLLELPFHAA
jgi:hypothetical protein